MTENFLKIDSSQKFRNKALSLFPTEKYLSKIYTLDLMHSISLIVKYN